MKKYYIKPVTEEIRIMQQSHLLNASEQVPISTEGSANDAEARQFDWNSSNSIWDEEEEY